MPKFQHTKRENARWEISPLHLCLFVKLHNNHLPAHGTSHSRLACRPQAPYREEAAMGTLVPGESLRCLSRWQAVQAVAVCFEKLNIFMKELKYFPLVLTRQALLKATGTVTQPVRFYQQIIRRCKWKCIQALITS